MNCINVLIIAACWVFLLDISGGWQALSSAISRWLTNGKISRPFELKPFSCSLCMTFWSGLAYLLIENCLTLPMVAYVCMVAYLTPRINDMLHVVDAALAKLFNLLNSKL